MKKTVFITGASSGIGLVIATRLHEAGFEVFGTSRTPDRHRSQVPFNLLQLDITDPQSVAACVQQLFSKVAKLDVFINNAGSLLSGLIEETTLEQGRQQFETNFWGTVQLTQAVLPYLRRQRHGQIITVGSVLGRIGMPNAGFYSASKHALEGFFKSLRFELSPFNIRVSVVGPSFFKTNIDKNAVLTTAKLTDYDAFRSKVTAFADAGARQAPEPAPIADTVLAIIQAEHPTFNYPVGKGARLFPFFQNLAYKQFEKAFLKQVNA